MRNVFSTTVTCFLLCGVTLTMGKGAGPPPQVGGGGHHEPRCLLQARET